MGLGLAIFVDILLRLRGFEAHYTESGVAPFQLLFDSFQASYQGWSLFFLSNTKVWAIFLFAAALFAAVCFILGYKTRTSTIVLWVLMVSIQARCPYICFGADFFVRILLFWSMWLPLGKVWSLDSHKEPAQYFQVCSGASFALMWQVALAYWFNAIAKGHSMWRIDHTAVEYTLKLNSFSTDFGSWLLQFPELLAWATHFTLWLEELGPILLFLPFFRGHLKTLAVGLFVFFHLGMLATTMHLGIFPYICAVAWIPFLPTSFWEKTLKKKDTIKLEKIGLQQWQNALCGLLCVYVLLWNIRTVIPEKSPWFLPRETNWIAQITRLDQKWHLFAPRPRTTDMWFVAEARLKNGKVVDLLNDDRPADFVQPHDLWERYSGCRERGFMANLYLRADESRLSYFVRYLANDREGEISELRLYIMECDHLTPEKGFICRRLWPYEGMNASGKPNFKEVPKLAVPIRKP